MEQKVVELIKLLKCLHGGKLTFVVCRRQDGGKDWLVWSRGIIQSTSPFSCGDQSGFEGVGTILDEKWVNNVISVKRYDHCCLQLRFLVGTII